MPNTESTQELLALRTVLFSLAATNGYDVLDDGDGILNIGVWITDTDAWAAVYYDEDRPGRISILLADGGDLDDAEVASVNIHPGFELYAARAAYAAAEAFKEVNLA